MVDLAYHHPDSTPKHRGNQAGEISVKDQLRVAHSVKMLEFDKVGKSGQLPGGDTACKLDFLSRPHMLVGMKDDPDHARSLELLTHLHQIGWVRSYNGDGGDYDVVWSPGGWRRFNDARIFLMEIHCYPIETRDIETLRGMLGVALPTNYGPKFGDMGSG